MLKQQLKVYEEKRRVLADRVNRDHEAQIKVDDIDGLIAGLYQLPMMGSQVKQVGERFMRLKQQLTRKYQLSQ